MTPGQPPTSPANRPLVLLVDDEPQLLQATREGLEVEFDVETAASAAAAEKLMAARNYAVVVSDHVLPGEAGLDFLVRMREQHPQTRRILLTGYMNPELLSRSVAIAGLSTCLIKPVPPPVLARAVRDAARA